MKIIQKIIVFVLCLALFLPVITLPTAVETAETSHSFSSKSKASKKKSSSVKATVEVNDLQDAEYEEYTTRTLELVRNTDHYAISTTGVSSEALSMDEINDRLSKYGSLINPGMPDSEYREAMEYEWKYSSAVGEYKRISFDVSSKMTYDKYVEMLYELSKVDGVNLYQIGYSFEGRDIFCIELDFPCESTKQEEKKETLMLTGNVHTREFAGSNYIMKELINLVNDYLDGKKAAVNMLKKVRIAAIPVCSLDAREGMIEDPDFWTNKSAKNYSPSNLWKALADGTDLNRNFPSVTYSLLGKDEKVSRNVASEPQFMGYAGEHAGCTPEAKAVMKFFCHYILVQKAKYYIDYHQQGRVVYFGKAWLDYDISDNCDALYKKVKKITGYSESCDNKDEGKFVGGGSTMTDMALSYASGAKFSPAYGFFVMTGGKKEKTILELKTLKDKGYTAANPYFAALTLEIGYGTKYLGYTYSNREKNANEFYEYNFDTFLYGLFGY